ncbi:hypothetical protein [Ferrimonas lipolytica]|uniref:Lipoprotein n=1 Tax=Ferrimonas lipolytica TaxID=2724191 RepID=A0A6H1UFU7_9GAMM|nr:hypothetical protein [Ferrimonas lipolytica]QIZ77193.1 hypothetical protein HER31_10075 [Ferrimonas lipolytica]
MKKIILMAAVFALTACSSKSPTTQALETMSEQEIAENSLGYKCESTRVTGSIMSKKRCTTRAQREEARRKAKEMLDARKSQIGADSGS